MLRVIKEKESRKTTQLRRQTVPAEPSREQLCPDGRRLHKTCADHGCNVARMANFGVSMGRAGVVFVALGPSALKLYFPALLRSTPSPIPVLLFSSISYSRRCDRLAACCGRFDPPDAHPLLSAQAPICVNDPRTLGTAMPHPRPIVIPRSLSEIARPPCPLRGPLASQSFSATVVFVENCAPTTPSSQPPPSSQCLTATVVVTPPAVAPH